jgi:hypothetical protein
MEGKDRNTLLLIVILFAISIIALIVVLSLAWRVAGDTVVDIFDFFVDNVEVRRTDYDFAVPATD